MASTIRPLASALVSNISFKKSNQNQLTLNFQGSSSVAFFQDRPGFKATTLDWGKLSKRKSWNKLFGHKATFHALIDNKNELHVITIKKPKQISENSYSAKIKLNQSALPSDLDDAEEISLFTDLNQNKRKGKYESSNWIPSGSDFMGHLEAIEISVNPKNEKIQLKGSVPFQLSHFSSNTVRKESPGSISLNDFSSLKQWNRLFGDVNPNSALAWRNQAQDFIFTFKQSRPKVRKDGSWTIQAKPLIELGASSNDFFETIKSRGQILLNDSTLMIDSSGNNVTGTINWNDVSNVIDLLDSWLQKHPDTLCDSVSAADALIGGLEGAAAGAIAGVAAGGIGGAVTGLAILSIAGTVADVTGAPEVIGTAAGAVGGAAVGAATGSAALSAAMAAFDAGISGTVCDYITGETGSEDRLNALIQETESLFTFGTTIIDDIGEAVNEVTKVTTNVIGEIKGWF